MTREEFDELVKDDTSQQRVVEFVRDTSESPITIEQAAQRFAWMSREMKATTILACAIYHAAAGDR